MLKEAQDIIESGAIDQDENHSLLLIMNEVMNGNLDLETISSCIEVSENDVWSPIDLIIAKAYANPVVGCVVGGVRIGKVIKDSYTFYKLKGAIENVGKAVNEANESSSGASGGKIDPDQDPDHDDRDKEKGNSNNPDKSNISGPHVEILVLSMPIKCSRSNLS